MSKPLLKDALIYMVDDDKHAIKLVEVALRDLGAIVKGFTDPREFLKEIKSNRPDLCLIDIFYADANLGAKIVQAIRKVYGKDVPLFAISASKDPKIKSEAIRLGSNEYIQKPFNVDILTVKIMKALKSFAPKSEQKKPLKNPNTEIPPAVSRTFEALSGIIGQLRENLESFDEFDTRVDFYRKKMVEYREPFTKVASALSKEESKPDIEKAIRLYGLHNTRIFLISTKLREALKDPVKFHKDSGRPDVAPTRILTYSHNLYQHFGDDSRYAEIAFETGLAFDILKNFCSFTGDQKSRFNRLFDEIYAHGVRTVDYAIELSKKEKAMPLEKYLCGTALLNRFGQLLMALFEKDYFAFRLKYNRIGIPEPWIQSLEQRRYGVSSSFLAAIFIQLFPNLHAINRSLYYFQMPFLLDSPETNDLFHLTRICNQAAKVTQP